MNKLSMSKLLAAKKEESKPDGNAATGLVEKKAGPPGGLGKLLENKKGGAEGGLSNALGKKAGFGQLLNKNLGNAAEKKGGGSFGNILDKKGGGASALGKMNFGPFGKRGVAKPGKGDDEHGILEGISSLHSWIKSQTMIKPNQKMKGKHAAMYDEAEDEDVVITLVAKNPQAPKNKIRYDHNTGGYVEIKLVERMIDHLNIESTVVHKDSMEGKKQIQLEAGEGKGFKSFSTRLVQAQKKEKLISMLVSAADKMEEEEEDDSEDDDDGEQKSRKRKGSESSEDSTGGDNKRQNQFSFVERATQTKNNAEKDTEMQTEPPPSTSFSQTVNQWVIYDSYVEYELKKELQDEEEMKKKTYGTKAVKKRMLDDDEDKDGKELSDKVVKAARVLERMVNQNIYIDVALDFKYWEDASDEFRESEGTLLPLWKFFFEKAKKLEVTGICWNPAYQDLFAVAYGSYNFYEQNEKISGYVCLFSLKNPSYPEYVCYSPCGVMCLDVNSKHPHMIVVGLADGNVAVYNLQIGGKKPAYLSSATNGKHRDTVWQVKWSSDNLDGYLNFYSISGDGRVTNWTIVKTSLWNSDILNITFTKQLNNFNQEDAFRLLRDGGRCVAFNPGNETIFLVGTDEGLIYKCTTEYSSKFLGTYVAHNTPIYNVAWNSFVPSIFLTCASEWMIKIWDHKGEKPLFMFDLNSQVGDVAWAPYSSTVFAAVTVDGKAHIFDLNVDKYHPICSQQIVSKKKAKLNHVAFNAHHPILIVGDSRGGIQCLKLSPNLRKLTKGAKTAALNKDKKKLLELEVKKLLVILAQVREHDDKEDGDKSDEEDDPCK